MFLESIFSQESSGAAPLAMFQRGFELCHVLFLNCLVAYGLNISSSIVVSKVNAVGFCLAGAVKNIVVLLVASAFLGDSLSAQQVAGYSFALASVVLYSLSKQFPRSFDRGLVFGILS